MKNYYKILGVLDDAEDIIIRAAYKALAQKYHPDKWRSDPKTANQRMSEINEAYAILSDAVKRKEYDEEFFSNSARNDAENVSDDGFDEVSNEEIEGWELALDFFPNIKRSYEELKKISLILANTYRSALVQSKEYKSAEAIRNQFESEYLKRFYGENKSIQEFAKSLLINGHPKAAIKVNKIVRLLGSSVSYHQIVNKIFEEFPEARKQESQEKKENTSSPHKYTANLNKAKSNIASGRFFTDDLICIVESLLKTYVQVDRSFFSDKYIFQVDGSQKVLSHTELLIFARNLILAENNKK